ncbi:MAG TPA: acetyl esterase [Lentisphaeria bacterium]|nr:acetyl esterase [Lentisphaeria bacterium]
MVLSKSNATAIWGWADPDETVVVSLSGLLASAKAGKDGKWMVNLNLKELGAGPFELMVKGRNELKIQDVMVGEVWLASGQSNMLLALQNTLDADKELSQSANSMQRHFEVKLKHASEPAEDCEGSWKLAGPSTARYFSAVAYYFGKNLQKELKVPVGIMMASCGGTHVESWTSADALSTDPELKVGMDKILQESKDYPRKKEEFVSSFGAWLKENGREDRPTEDVSAFAGETDSLDDWKPVKIPGVIKADGIPDQGAIWFRQDIDLPADLGKKKLELELGVLDGFETVYWNGKEVAKMTYKEYSGTPCYRRYELPENLFRAGKNTLAIRIFSPASRFKFIHKVKAGSQLFGDKWTAKTEFALPPLTPKIYAKAPELRRAEGAVGSPSAVPASLFNGMIHPLVNFPIRGVIWYQGEGNATRACQYRKAFPLMIKDWRTRWKQETLPFYYCQLANNKGKNFQPEESRWAELREAQAMALQLPNTGMAVLIDLGESDNIHPGNKRDVGERLAKIALAQTYGKDIVYSGPVYRSMKVEGDKIRIEFTHAEKGLVAKKLPEVYQVNTVKAETAPLVPNSPGSELEGFAICGEDKQWVWADAKIEGQSVLVWSAKVPSPVAVRYAWAENPTCNLYNKADLPATPFRTDQFPELSRNSKY